MSYQLRELLKRHEGVKTHAYKDHLGYVTVGVGRCLEDEIGLGLSEDEIDYLLNNDIARCREELISEYSWFVDIDSVRQEALINLSFNIGHSKWASQVGDRALEVCQMIKSGEYQVR